MMFLHAIIIVAMFLGGYAILKRMFPDIKHLFDIYVVAWIAILLAASGGKAWKLVWESLHSTFTGLF